MEAPLYRALDVVRVADLPYFREDGSAGREGFVYRVRRYASGYSYEVGTLDDTEDDAVSGLYSEECLEATGRRIAFEVVRDWADEESPTGRPSELLDEHMDVIPGRGFTIVDDLSDHRS